VAPQQRIGPPVAHDDFARSYRILAQRSRPETARDIVGAGRKHDDTRADRPALVAHGQGRRPPSISFPGDLLRPAGKHDERVLVLPVQQEPVFGQLFARGNPARSA